MQRGLIGGVGGGCALKTLIRSHHWCQLKHSSVHSVWNQGQVSSKVSVDMKYCILCLNRFVLLRKAKVGYLTFLMFLALKQYTLDVF